MEKSVNKAPVSPCSPKGSGSPWSSVLETKFPWLSKKQKSRSNPPGSNSQKNPVLALGFTSKTRACTVSPTRKRKGPWSGNPSLNSWMVVWIHQLSRNFETIQTQKKSTSPNSDLLYLQKGQSLWTAHIHWNSSRTIDLHHLTHHGVAYLPGYRNWKSSHASLLERSNSIPGNPPGVSAKWLHGAKSAPEECQIKAATCCLTVPSLPRNRKKGGDDNGSCYFWIIRCKRCWSVSVK